MFSLPERLKADTFPVAELALSSVLLMNNALFPWLILVPRIAGASEIVDLTPQDQATLMREIAQASHILRTCFTPDKLNIAALGNQVPTLHVHVIARFKHDSAWPNPVWGNGTTPYEDASPLRLKLAALFAENT